MPSGQCTKSDCTVSETGICLLSHSDPTECPNFRRGDDQVELPRAPESPPQDAPDAVATTPEPRRFHSGFELGTQDAAEIMRARYAHLIGVLGSTDAGKTCFLSSLYLMASHGGLRPNYRFAGSLTLQGFEDRARRLRRWESGRLPEKLSDHTFLADPRSAALLHLALQQTQDRGRRIDLLLTDLPGEWTTTLIDRADSANRFDFLHRADGIILVIDGPRLASPESRHLELQQMKLFLTRLVENVGIDVAIPLVLLVSKCDLLGMDAPDGINQISTYAGSLGFVPAVILAAAFSSRPEEIKNGTGVLEAITAIVEREPSPCQVREIRLVSCGGRVFQRFQR